MGPNSFFLPFFSSTPYNCHRLPGQNNYTEFFKTPYTLQKTSINMKFFSQLLVLGLVAEATVASSWFSKSVYNKWHETELERWLSDHNVPYPTPYDRAQLETAVKDNWQTKVSQPYSDWDSAQLSAYLKQKGVETKDAAADNTEGLVAQVKKYWYETEDKAEDAWSSVKDWIFDSWTESQLKAFADNHGIPVPQPRARDTLLQKVRSGYETAAQKAGETAAYPGNWLYQSWSESDLKEWLDLHGIPAPQPTTRDKLIASVRRNARIASLKAADMQASASKSAAAAAETLSDKLLDSWSDSQIKEWADKNGIKVPQGSRRNELLAIARKHRAQLTGDNVSYSAKSAASKASDSGASAFGAATSRAGNEYAKATDDAALKADDLFQKATSTWASLVSRRILMPVASRFLKVARRTSFWLPSARTDTRLPLAGLHGPSTPGLPRTSRSISLPLGTRLLRRQASKPMPAANNCSRLLKLLTLLPQRLVVLATPLSLPTSPSRLMPRRTPCLIPGRSQSSRTTCILTDSMFLKDQPRTNWSLTLVTQETTSNTVQLHLKERFGPSFPTPLSISRLS